MAKASINFATAKGGGESEKHMDRDKDHKVSYLLENDSKNNEYKTYRSSQDYLSAAKLAAKEKTGRSMQQKAIDNFIQEAVINLNENHTIQDVEKVFEDLQKEFGGFEVFKIAVHKDEGVFIDTIHDQKDLEYDSKTLTWSKEGVDVTNDVIDHAPGRNIFYNDQDKNWYSDKDLTKEVDTSKFQKHFNYHAHVQFTKFDMSQGRNARGANPKVHGLGKKDLSRIQDINAKVLGMVRGEKWSKSKRMNHYQIKQAHDSKREAKLTTIKVKDLDDLKKEIKAEMIKEGGHTPQEYQALNKEIKDLKAKLKIKELSNEQLVKQMLDLKKGKEAKISVNPTPSTTNTVKNDLKPISDELYKELEPQIRQSENNQEEQRQLGFAVKTSLEADTDKLIDSHITKEVVKRSFGKNLEFDVIDPKAREALKRDIRIMQNKHQGNYKRYDELLAKVKKPAKLVMSIVSKMKDIFNNEKRQERIQNKSQNKGRGI